MPAPPLAGVPPQGGRYLQVATGALGVGVALMEEVVHS